MKGYNVYRNIQQLKTLGFSKRNVAEQLQVHRNTVNRYWDMSPEDFDSQRKKVSRSALLDSYQAIILTWLKQHPSVTAAQVCDWLKEYYTEPFKERTVSRYVRQLRLSHGLKKTMDKQRDYEAVDELPPGLQMQVDFGEKTMPTVGGGQTKVRFAAFVLSHSRQKYLEFLDRPFTAADLVVACRNCFRFFGGMPKELVFDQDSIVCVAENYGQIIHTYEFEKFRQEYGFVVYMCRKADPQTKGKIENVVKYVKQNFLAHRLYPGDDSNLNRCALDWLDRTANAKHHGTTKRSPDELFLKEREHLLALPSGLEHERVDIVRTVRKDNTIIYNSNRYSVPLGTYNTQKEVTVRTSQERLFIMTVFGDAICDHALSANRGQLIKNNSHGRDNSHTLDAAMVELDQRLKGQATDYLQQIRDKMSRYVRDQFQLLNSLCDKYGVDKLLEAIAFCQHSRLLSATYARDYLRHWEKPVLEVKPVPIPVSDNKYHVTTQKRSLEVYAKAGGHR